MKSLIKEIFFGLTAPFVRGLDGRASILMYHSVGDNGAFFTVKPTDFEKQMKFISGGGSSRGLKAVKLSRLVEMLKNREDVSGRVAVTFDDGYADNASVALPVLEKYGIPTTVFVATDFMGKAMTNSDGITIETAGREALRRLAASGLVELMPHTASHRPLTSYGNDSWKEDMEKSRRVLRSEFGSKADIFAYPRGKFAPVHAEYLRRNGYAGAVTVNVGLVKPGDDLFRLKRNSVDSTTTMAQFKGKLSRAVEWYAVLRGLA